LLGRGEDLVANALSGQIICTGYRTLFVRSGRQ
jgi:hypothetical protein